MRMLSGRMHWLMVGLALLVSAQGFTTVEVRGQAPLKPATAAAKKQMAAQTASYAGPMASPYGMPPGMGGLPGGMMPGMPGAPMSMAFPGPAPMEVTYASALGHRACDAGCDSMGGCGSCGGCNTCGGMACGGRGCGLMGGRSGSLLGGGCGMCGGSGCGACGSSLFGGRLLGMLGPLAPFVEGSGGAQRWFDVYAGTIGLRRTSDFGGFSTATQDLTTGQFERSFLISTDGTGTGTPRLRTNDLDLDRIRYGAEIIANLQTGVGSNLEARYFGLNNWETSATASVVASGNPTLYSAFSVFGTVPTNGFDDTDRSFIHTISYNSELHNGEINYRRRWVSPAAWAQGSWLAGVRYFDLDERFGFNATGSNNNTFTFNQLRFFNFDTRTRNQLTGFQMGGDFWVNVVPGIQVGVEGKAGIFGNHAEVEAQAFSNSIPGAREFMQDGKTAYLTEFTASTVYRLTHSWSVRASYNLLYVDNVALAPENVNTRDFSNAIGLGSFTPSRFPFMDVDGEVLYQGWSIGGEWLY